jgi:hypothetical protein
MDTTKQIQAVEKGYLDRAKTDGTLTGVSGSATGSNGVASTTAATQSPAAAAQNSEYRAKQQFGNDMAEGPGAVAALNAKHANPLNTLAQYNTGGETGDKYVLSAEATKKLGLRANVRGPGGPTDDMVPGEKYGAPGTALSDGEVIGEPSELLDAISKKLTGKEPGPTMVQRKGLRAGLAFSGTPPMPLEDVARINRGLTPLTPGQPMPVDEVMQANKVFRAAPPAAPAYNPGPAPQGVARRGLGVARSVVGPAAMATAGITGAAKGLQTGTEGYANRMGFTGGDDPNIPSNRMLRAMGVEPGDGARFMNEQGIRGLGVMSDVGADFVDGTTGLVDMVAGTNIPKLRSRFSDVKAAKPLPEVVQPTTPEERAAAVAERAATELKADPSKGLRKETMGYVYGDEAAVPEGATYSLDHDSGANRLTWNSKDDAAGKTIGDKVRPANGTGIVSIRQADGSFKNVILGPSEYTKADGTKTANHRESARYAQGLRDRANLFEQDRVLSRMRAESDAFNPEITDPNVRNQGLRKLTGIMLGEQQAAQNAAARGSTALQAARLGFDMQKEARESAREGAKDAEAVSDKRATDFDKDIKDHGYEGAEAQAFREYFMQNYPGLLALPASQRRAAMPLLRQKYEENKVVRAVSGNDSVAEFRPTTKRTIKLSDAWKPGTPLPTWNSEGDTAADVGLKQYLQAKVLPNVIGGIDDEMWVEAGADGTEGRKVTTNTLHRAKGSQGTLDRDMRYEKRVKDAESKKKD